MPAGRPPLFSSPDELELKVDEYFKSTLPKFEPGDPDDEDDDGHYTQPIPVTITGLAVYLGFESRQSFYDYEKHEQFSYIIKRARLRVECEYEKRLQMQSPTGAIFALKNMGWSDKQEIDQKTEHSGGISISWQEPELPNTEDKGST